MKANVLVGFSFVIPILIALLVIFSFVSEFKGAPLDFKSAVVAVGVVALTIVIFIITGKIVAKMKAKIKPRKQD